MIVFTQLMIINFMVYFELDPNTYVVFGFMATVTVHVILIVTVYGSTQKVMTVDTYKILPTLAWTIVRVSAATANFYLNDREFILPDLMNDSFGKSIEPLIYDIGRLLEYFQLHELH